MKKIISILLVIFMTISITACGTPDGFTDESYRIALDALDITDQYIDAEIDSDSAIEKIDRLKSLLNIEESNYDGGDSEVESNLFMLSSDLRSLTVNIRSHNYESGSLLEDFELSDLIDCRNELAERVGEKTR